MKKYKTLNVYKKIEKFAKLGNVEIEKQKFHQHKRSVYFNKQYRY